MATRPRAQRQDASRNVEAILDAAVGVLAARPDASVAEVARASGLSRQTVYAHFSSRPQLLEAVVRRAVGRTVEAIDAARPDEGPADEALTRLLEISWTTVARHGAVLDAAVTELSPDTFHALHAPVLERLGRLIERGRESGAFDRDVPAAWLLAAFLGLAHAAGQEVTAGRLTAAQATPALRATVLKAFRPG